MGKIINNNIKKNVVDVASKVGIFAGSLLFATVAAYFYSPVFYSHADDSETAEVSVDVQPVASITTDISKISFNVVPTDDGTFDSKPIVATVATNSLGGYELYFSSEDNSTDMTHTNTTFDDVIASDFEGAVTSSTMTKNKWGYSLDNTNFSKIPTLASHAMIRYIDDLPTTAEKSTTVYFGAKVSPSIRAGNYTKNVVFSAIAHATPGPTVFNIRYMQDMTPTICANATTPVRDATEFDWDGSHHDDTNYIPRQKLKDIRDGKYYLVSKLADGNCWMSQSLALDLTADEPIIASNNDGTTTTVTPNNTTQNTTKKMYWTKVEDNWRSYSPQPDDSYYQGGITKSSTPTGSDIAYNWEKAGNYYNWYAVTAGTGTSALASSDAPSSICPKGWRLPTSTGSKSYINLLYTAYNLASQTGAALRAAPLNFNLSGYYAYYVGGISAQGTVGYYWTSTASSNANQANVLGFYDSAFYPQSASDKGFGFTVRCVAI